MGRYIAHAITQIPASEIEEATRGGYPTVLVIVPQPYRDQIICHLEGAGYYVDSRRDTDSRLSRETGLSILKLDHTSNLGWRIILAADAPFFFKDSIVATEDTNNLLFDVLPTEYREGVLAEVDAYDPISYTAAETGTLTPRNIPTVKVTSFEGAKGLSAQHVYIASLHNGELPHDPASIKDLEICKFVVGLTRTRKKCTLIRTRNFAGNWKSPSAFISWIDSARLKFIKVDAQYWKQQT